MPAIFFLTTRHHGTECGRIVYIIYNIYISTNYVSTYNNYYFLLRNACVCNVFYKRGHYTYCTCLEWVHAYTQLFRLLLVYFLQVNFCRGRNFVGHAHQLLKGLAHEIRAINTIVLGQVVHCSRSDKMAVNKQQ